MGPEEAVKIDFDEFVERVTGQSRPERGMGFIRAWIKSKHRKSISNDEAEMNIIETEMQKLRLRMPEMTRESLSRITKNFALWKKGHLTEVNTANANKRKPGAEKN
jgi:hypothetical protein